MKNQESNDEYFYGQKNPAPIPIPIWTAVKVGMVAALIMSLVTVLINVTGNHMREGIYLLRYLILAGTIGYAFYTYKKSLPSKNRLGYGIGFGILIAVIMAIGEILLNIPLGLINYQLIIADIFPPVNSIYKFAIVEIALLFNGAVFGFFISLVLGYAFDFK
ncbi:MAG: hypothetical protein DHS20C18_42940 [Saprospiraceae bacterium]|nr:MAG: hypothetical protein DHS20C18_42940 [Saprospiraceae bacterium]